MRRSEAAKYARWSAAAALMLAGLTAGVYLERKWVAYREKQKAPPPAPQDVERRSNGITFSKGEGTRKIFTVEASKMTDFKGKDASLLEDVKITIFGNSGERHDIIHTQSCQYEKNGGDIACSGEVQFDLESKAEAERAARNPDKSAQQKVHVETRRVVFNRASGLARTDQPVKFNFPNGTGEAVGVEYQSAGGTVRLLKDVQFSLMAPSKATAEKVSLSTAAKEPIRVTGKSLDFERESRTMQLYGPVEAKTQTTSLYAGKLTLTLDAAFRAQKILATPGANGKNPKLESRGQDGPTNLSAETLTAQLAPEGWLTKIEAVGMLQGTRQAGKETEDFRAEQGKMELWPKINQPQELNLKGRVLLKTRAESAGETRTLQTNELQVQFADGKKGEGSKLKRAETLGAGTIEWTDSEAQGPTPGAAGSGDAARTRLQADKLEMEFGEEGRARHLVATGNVAMERAAGSKPVQTATAQSGVAQLLASGGWSQMDLQGSVKLKEGDRSAQADHATFVRATQTALLTGRALARDTASETQAPRITFVQTTGEIRAEGGVRSTEFSAKGGGAQLAPVPANISADTLQGNSKAGKALYTGHARLWQGDSVMEADSIELLRESRVMNANGNVRAVFPQAAGQSAAQTVALRAGPKKPRLWHVTAGTLIYRDTESRAHLEKNVVAQSAEQTMRGAAVDLYFTRAEKPNLSAAANSPSANPVAGAQQISRAVGTGGVIVEQGTRKATAERGEYSATDGKFVMSGGNPTIFDATEGTTTGHQLTFFLADDTIIVDSENGSRTLTKHRVEK
ncbi:MAG TPA: LptA/OstA family protein [Candidatus Acidoferrum sp.]|nr:LptA/OstA family protein [Candidatus Acidoferrum sp.]